MIDKNNNHESSIIRNTSSLQQLLSLLCLWERKKKARRAVVMEFNNGLNVLTHRRICEMRLENANYLPGEFSRSRLYTSNANAYCASISHSGNRELINKLFRGGSCFCATATTPADPPTAAGPRPGRNKTPRNGLGAAEIRPRGGRGAVINILKWTMEIYTLYKLAVARTFTPKNTNYTNDQL